MRPLLAVALGGLLACAQTVATGGGAAAAKASSGTPVVEVVFDEVATATLMNAAGTRIDAGRFPGFARLAANSTWYPNNTTVADFTGRAVPAIETGINPDYEALPTAADHRDSIFTALGRGYRFNVSEALTKVCPRSLCHNGGSRLQKPAGEFIQGQFEPPKPAEFRRWLGRIRPGGRSFNFIHIELPHEPFRFLPDGRSYNFSPISDLATANAQRWAVGAGGVATTLQRHYLQTGYTDRLVQRMIARLKRIGIWRTAIVIVTADNGIAFDPKTFRRIAVPGNLGGVANTPLFVKYPGQSTGQVSDVGTQSIDLVPTIAQALGIELPYRADGRPIAEDAPDRPIAVANAFKRVVTAPVSELVSQRGEILASTARWLGARTGLYRLGPRPDLLGRRVGRRSAGGATIDPRLDFARGRDRKLPAFVNGTIGAAPGRVIAIAVKGRVVATCRSFRFRGRTRWGAVVPPSRLHSGRDSVSVHLVRGR